MSAYTMSLRHIIDNYDYIHEENGTDLTGREYVESWFKDYDLNEFLTSDQIKVISEYGVFNKDKLARMIVDHYYMREIGYETPHLFEIMVKTKMRELMSYYADLIYTASIKYDLMVNVNVTETVERATSNTGKSSSNSTSSGLGVNSDTPQGQINKTEILQGKYASSTGASESTGNASENASSEGKESIIRNRKGNDGVLATAQKMIAQYRDNIRNINYEIIKDLNEMFIGLY